MSKGIARRRISCSLSVGLAALLFLAMEVSAARAGLSFERPDGSKIRSGAPPRVWCGPWDDQSARRTIHVMARGARRGWEVSAVRRDLAIGRPIEFPNAFVSTKPRGAQIFAYSGAIEASSAEEESSGSIVFSQVSCRLGGTVEFSVEAVLGSELFGGKPVRVSGTFRGRVSQSPHF